METKNQNNLGFYNKWETPIDTLTFLGSGILTCAIHQISVIEPSGLGILLSAGTNALGLAATQKMLSAGKIESQFLKICALISALAITTFSLPLLFGALGAHTFILLTTQRAIELGLINLVAKVATYAAFKSAVFFQDRFFFDLPKDTDAIERLDDQAILQVKENLVNYPEKGKYISLPVQVALNKKLVEKGQESLPYISFSEIGKEWSREDLKILHGQDLSHLPLHKRAAIAELFMHHHFPPQMRPYTKDEVPEFESLAKKKTLTHARAGWAHLIFRLKPNAQLSPKVNEQFYQMKFPPPRKDSLDLPLPVNQKSIESLENYQIAWYFNLFSEKSKVWDSLPAVLQTAFNNRFSKQLPVTGAPSKVTWIPEGLTWKLAGLAVVVRATIYAVKKAFAEPPKPAVIGTSLMLFETATRSSAAFVKEMFTIPDWVRPTIVNPVEQITQIAQPIIQATKASISTALVPYIPQNVSLCSVVEPIKEIAKTTINYSTAPLVPALNASEIVPSYNLFAITLVGIGAIGALVSLYACFKRQDQQAPLHVGEPQERDLVPVPKQLPPPPLDRKRVSVYGPQELALAQVAQESHIGVEYEDPQGQMVRALIDLNNPVVIKKLLRINPQLLINLRQIVGQTIQLSDPNTIRQLQALALPAHNIPLLEEAPPPQVVEMIEVEADHSKKTWDDFNAYVQRHCRNVDLETAERLAKEGIIILQKLMKGEPVKKTNLDYQLVAACWGLMLHAISKNRGFVEGTFDVLDTNFRIFDFFFPALYGRKSSHYPKRAIAIEDGKWKDYKHFGADLSKLPANKRTVMLGKITTMDGSHRTYVKMENWGANLNLISDPIALRNFYQVIFHSLEFFESAAKKAAPSIFGEVGGGENMRKEHMLHSDAAEIAELIKKIFEQDQTIVPPNAEEISKFGFQSVIPYFEQIMKEGKISSALRTNLEDYQKRIFDRYGSNRFQNGNEVPIGHSIYDHKVDTSSVTTEAKPEELNEDDLAIVGMSSSIELPKDWEIASSNFLSHDYIFSGTVRAYADYLTDYFKKTDIHFSFVHEFLYPVIIENSADKDSLIEDIFNLPFAEKQPKGPIFIPLILESNARWLPWVGNYFPDHIVLLVLDPENRTYEYYNSQGGALALENRKVLGIGKPANELFKKYILDDPRFKNWSSKHNSAVHQRDYTNCGAFLCWFMKKRVVMNFKPICDTQNIDIRKERSELANDLSRFYAPLVQDIKPTRIEQIGKNRGKIHERSIKEMIQEDIQRYLIKEEIDSGRLFDDIDQNRQVHFRLNREQPKDAKEIFDTLRKTGKNDKEVLSLMTLLRPAIFNAVSESIWRELNTIGQEQCLKIQNSGKYDFYVETEDDNIRITCTTTYTVTDKDDAKVDFNANVFIDTKANKVIECWNLPE